MIIDTRGKQCPEPLVITRRAIKGAVVGDVFEVLSDNDTSCGNLMNYLASLGLSPQCEASDDGVFCIRFEIGESCVPSVVASRPAESLCSVVPSVEAGYAVVLSSSTMGRGDDELGAMLMRAFVNSLVEAKTLPYAVVLYNSGALLAVEGTDTAASLAVLQQMGVQVLVCGACVDYYALKDRLSAGRMSNMLEITNALIAASHILYP